MATLKKVDESNYRRVLDMKLPEEQGFVAPNVVSLAQAWVFYEQARPMVIFADEVAVGFLMLDYDLPTREAGIWRLMIASEHQGKGYGTAAVQEAIRLIEGEKQFDAIYLDYVPGNTVARHI